MSASTAAAAAASSAAGSAARQRLSRAAIAAYRHGRREARRTGAPPSVLSVIPPSSVRKGGPNAELRTPHAPAGRTAGAAVRAVGLTRRVFLLNPYLTGKELSGLGHVVKVLGRNSGISSVLIGSNDDDDRETMATPTSVNAIDRTDKLSKVDVGQFGPGYGKAWHVAGGYDPLELYENGGLEDPSALGKALDGVRDLALGCRGGPEYDESGRVIAESKVPVITVPHGLVHDGGSAIFMSSYVLATTDTCFRLQNPSRGLTLDPAGLSFVLPRSGWEYDQPCARYSNAVATLLCLCRYEANADDLVGIGLATHLLGPASKLGPLEYALSQIDSWDAQAVRRKKKYTYDERYDMFENDVAIPVDEENAPFKNAAVAKLIFSSCEDDAAGEIRGAGWYTESVPDDDDYDAEVGVWTAADREKDPSLALSTEIEDLYPERSSDLVYVAGKLDRILLSNRAADVLDGLEEFAASNVDSSDPDESTCGEVARVLADNMKSQSPLALRVTHRLLQLGSGRNETLESCMEREGRAQRNMYRRDDFKYWAEAVSQGKVEEIGEFKGWKHASLGAVTDDEVDEIIGAE